MRAACSEPAGPPCPATIAHGGDLDRACARFPDAPLPWIDLSTGINPLPYPVPGLPREVWSRLPTAAEHDALLAAAARRYHVADIDTLVAAPGTQALIQLLPRLVPGSRVAVLGPTYDEHELCWTRQGHDVEVVDGIDAAFAAGATVIVAVNPNNPTGRLLSTGELCEAGARLAALDGLLVVDEAFVDVLPAGASVIPRRPPATVVLRSFGKTYGLAGVRLGFAVADPPIAARLRGELGPWCVAGPALAIGAAALTDAAWLAATTIRLDETSRRLDRLLATAGFEILGGTPLFRLARHAEAARMADRLGRHGINVRAFGRQPDWLRFGLPGIEAEWLRLADALGV